MSLDLHAAARALLGRTLANGWRVVEEVPKLAGATGGLNSRGYVALSPDGRRAYVKALDYSEALRSGDVAGELAKATSAYIFERALLQKCEERRLSRIVRALDYGQERVEDVGGIPTVDYLILELADADVREYLDTRTLDVQWALAVLHDVATGLNQLHTHRMAHQDVKPSNVLVFNATTTKLSDLGRALSRDDESPHDELSILGTPYYAPIEVLYGETSADWTVRCQGCDMYLLGSLGLFLFGSAGMTPAVLTRLPDEVRPWHWTDSYDQALPLIRAAFAEVLEEFAECLPVPIRDEMLQSTAELCDPDPRLRGHPKTRQAKGSSYRLERYIALYDLLARRAHVHGLSDALR